MGVSAREKRLKEAQKERERERDRRIIEKRQREYMETPQYKYSVKCKKVLESVWFINPFGDSINLNKEVIGNYAAVVRPPRVGKKDRRINQALTNFKSYFENMENKTKELGFNDQMKKIFQPNAGQFLIKIIKDCNSYIEEVQKLFKMDKEDVYFKSKINRIFLELVNKYKFLLTLVKTKSIYNPNHLNFKEEEDIESEIKSIIEYNKDKDIASGDCGNILDLEKKKWMEVIRKHRYDKIEEWIKCGQLGPEDHYRFQNWTGSRKIRPLKIPLLEDMKTLTGKLTTSEEKFKKMIRRDNSDKIIPSLEYPACKKTRIRECLVILFLIFLYNITRTFRYILGE